MRGDVEAGSAVGQVEKLPRAYLSFPGRTAANFIPLGVPSPKESPIPPISLAIETRDQLAAFLLFQVKWLQEKLGIDVSSRLFGDGNSPNIETAKRVVDKKITVYSDEGWKAFSQTHNLTPSMIGRVFTSRGIIAMKHGDMDQMITTLAHENLHILSGILFSVDIVEADSSYEYVGHRDNVIGIPSIGYALIGNKFKRFNEAITEMMAIEMLYDYQRETGQNYLSNSEIGYHPDILFFDLLFQSAAKSQEQSYTNFRYELYKGYFKTNHGVLRLLTKAVGKTTMGRLMDLTEDIYNDEEQMRELCKQCDVSYPAWRILVSLLEKGREEIPFLESIRLKGPAGL